MLLYGSFGSRGGCGCVRGYGVDETMNDYVDMFVCLMLYLLVVGMVGSVIGFLVLA